MRQYNIPADKAFETFAELMIEKLENFKGDWQKPWFTEGCLRMPKNLAGREYNGINVLTLLLWCEKKGYRIPRFVTFETVQHLNVGNDAKDLPRVLITKGEKSFPVLLAKLCCYSKETRERIKYEEYERLSSEEQSQYIVFPQWRVFRVFNVEQTNLRETRPEMWAKLEEEETLGPKHRSPMFELETVDRMIAENLWICPIKQQHQDNAFYSISRNEIVVPEKAQFKDGESFYGTLFHEMTHSTGAADVLGRIKPASFGSEEYAREELVAELGAALVAQHYGITKYIKEDSVAYMKFWIETMRQSPSYIKNILLDVKRAVSLITLKIDAVAAKDMAAVA